MGFLSRLSRPKDAVEAEAKVVSMQLTAKAARQTEKRDKAHDFRLEVQPQASLAYEVAAQDGGPPTLTWLGPS